ncbi:MAG: class I tRNA ligase family protein, partial [Desulfobacterales bacterium]|nr:class I tRNA ligase family protein [Desulfobacterales bacterium]
AYRRIRNTCRFMLGNFYDFNMKTDARPVASMSELDRFILHKLHNVVEKAVTAYENYEFHTIYHSLHNFCVVDLSSFYLDIIKDRLYASTPDAPARRDAQAVMAMILDALVKIMAPILPFTADEIYTHMPMADAHRKESVHLEGMVALNDDWEDAELAEKWEKIRALRAEVTKALEEARKAKLIGHPLDASVKIKLPEGELSDLLASLEMPLHDVFIVSQADLADAIDGEVYEGKEIEGLAILVSKADGEKCERCWRFDTTIGDDTEHPTACHRCATALKAILA